MSVAPDPIRICQEDSMTEGPTTGPIFEQPVAPVGRPSHEHHEKATDWVVVHRGGANSKAHVESLEHKLTKSGIRSRVSHDDDHKVILEVHRDDEKEALAVLGAENTHGAGRSAHQTEEARIEAEEAAALYGPFKATTMRWFLVLLAVAVLFFLALYWFSYTR
jgi:hypothetical protein